MVRQEPHPSQAMNGLGEVEETMFTGVEPRSPDGIANHFKRYARRHPSPAVASADKLHCPRAFGLRAAVSPEVS